MGLQKYRADAAEQQADGAVRWYAKWMDGRMLSKITNCRWEDLAGGPRVTVYTTGEPDTWFSVPAVCRYRGVIVKGYVTVDDAGNTVFRHTYY